MSDTKKLIKRMEAARDFPTNTCGASRHAQQVAEDLLHRRLPEREVMEHVGESIAATVTALWEARTTIARLESERDAARRGVDEALRLCAERPGLFGSFDSADAVQAAIRAAMQGEQ